MNVTLRSRLAEELDQLLVRTSGRADPDSYTPSPTSLRDADALMPIVEAAIAEALAEGYRQIVGYRVHLREAGSNGRLLMLHPSDVEAMFVRTRTDG